ncbi:MAG TPA: BNR-repeat neuraminidase N-terminal domain-containing protein, partial [Candidatus Cloacimonadota bacterium]|nr:BNR-repeat neuraminidase N-terminal domain-containing protein [Candidatus Cloacimonadota bacterium]
MKRYSIFLIILMLFISIAAWADQVTIGTGTSTQEGPLNRYWNYGAFEGIYLQSEVGPACTISAIGFNKASGSDVNPITSVTIYMKTTSETTLATGNYSTTGYTQVYSGSFPNTATSGWMEQTLTTPFNYDASGNLAILIVHGYQYYTSSRPYWYYTATADYKTRATYEDDEAPISLTANYNRPNIKITYTPSTPMVYTSSTTTQNTTSLYAGDANQQIIGMQVVMNGGLSPLSATQFTVNANGSTSVSDILNARIYYTGTSSTFAATNQFGSTVTSPTTANFNITGSQVLFAGTNYFWLTFDVSASAVAGHVIDGECSSLIVAGVSHVPTITAPTGNRSVLVPLTGTKTIATTGGDYASFTEAINVLNSTYIGAGGVTFIVTSGNVFTEDPPAITASGASDRPIIFQKSSTTAPILKPTGTTGTSDAGIAINGGDYITFDGINISIATGTAVEYGYYLYGTATNGAQHNTIKNCTISLSKSNTSSNGIHTYSIATTSAGANSYNKFYNVTITNCYSGISLAGSNTIGAEDTGNEIGTTAGVNSISNFGNSTGSVAGYGVYAYEQTNAKVFSTNAVSGTSSTGSLYGFYISGSSSTVDVYLNSAYTISSTSGSIYGIYVASGTAVNIYRNNIYGLTYSGSGAGAVYGIYISAGTTNNIYNNMIRTLAAANS